MKKIKSLVLIPFLLLCLCFSNCYFYKTIEQSPISYEEIKDIQSSKPTVFMQNNFSSALYRVDDFTITDSTFSGNAVFTLGVHEIDENAFKRNKSKEAEYNIDPLQSIHIVLRSDSMIHEGYFESPLSNIKSLKIHDKSKGSSSAATIGLVLAGAGIAIGIGFLFFFLAYTGAL